ncbi:MAG: hypothetical protein ACAI44_04205, partial [Candidatus Sericytochromatia bacterium]
MAWIQMLSLLPLGAMLGLGLAFQTPDGGQGVPLDRIAAQVPAHKPVRFVAFGDFGTGAGMQYKVSKAIQKKCA